KARRSRNGRPARVARALGARVCGGDTLAQAGALELEVRTAPSDQCESDEVELVSEPGHLRVHADPRGDRPRPESRSTEHGELVLDSQLPGAVEVVAPVQRRDGPFAGVEGELPRDSGPSREPLAVHGHADLRLLVHAV